ncbi:7346_t:CDS:2 [Entrophospora sp. SA101]|nr:7346_t:CDS:2 [Entrophospora sp. SA101]CAJ0833275.1 18974_t:CDS:2 [Entrophospora sp. SA101]
MEKMDISSSDENTTPPPKEVTNPSSQASSNPELSPNSSNSTETNSQPSSNRLQIDDIYNLNESQKAALDKAKAYIREIQTVLLQTIDKRNDSPPIDSYYFSTSNLGLTSGIMDLRSISVLSRIYVGSINFELTEQHVRVVFGQFGTIKSISMSLDPLTGKHKGFCFIEYETPEGASLALETMNVGRPNNYTAATAAGFLPPPKTRIYVSNVNEYISERDLMSIFESFGKIIHCVLMPDLITRKHKGYGFIEFEDEIAANTSVTSMNNFELGGLMLRVRKAVIGGPLSEGMKSIEKLPPPLPPPPQASSLSLFGGMSSSSTLLSAAAQNVAAKIAVDIVSRSQTSVESVAQEENMSITSSQQIDDALEDEIRDECNNYGKVVKVVVHISKDDGHEFENEEESVKIFVQYDDGITAEKAKQKLDNRWFGGRRISALLYDFKRFQLGDYSN